jgi:hypothetical protein
MTVLMILTATLIVMTVTVALSTTRDLARQKARLAKLTERQGETEALLVEATDCRKSIQGTREMLRSIVSSKKEQQSIDAQELEALQTEMANEPKISLGKPLKAALQDDFTDPEADPIDLQADPTDLQADSTDRLADPTDRQADPTDRQPDSTDRQPDSTDRQGDPID